MGYGVPETALGLIEWMDAKSIWWNKDLMRFGDGSGLEDSGGTGLWAREHVLADEQLCRIPKNALLSIRNTSIADLFEEAEVAGGLGLILAVMFERAQASSPWKGYLDFLPSREFLPTFWPKVLLELLEGTSLRTGKVLSDLQAMREDFGQVQAVMEAYPDRFESVHEKMTFESYLIAASWVSSRAFHVDAYHGMSLVPLADVFNHKASVVTISGDYIVAELEDAQNLHEASMHAAPDKPPPAGRNGASRSDLKRSRQKALEDEDPDNEDEAPPEQAVRIAKRKKQPRTDTPEGDRASEGADTKGGRKGEHKNGDSVQVAGTLPSICGARKSDNDPNATNASSQAVDVPAELRLEIAIVDVEDNEDSDSEKPLEGSKDPSADPSLAKGDIERGMEEDGGEASDGSLIIVAASDICKGNEIHNTYGEYSNLELLYKHGFALRQNPFNAVVVDMSDMGAAALSVIQGDAARERMEWLLNDIVDCSSDGEDSAEEEQGGEACCTGNGECRAGIRAAKLDAGAVENGNEAKCCIPGGGCIKGQEQADDTKGVSDPENGNQANEGSGQGDIKEGSEEENDEEAVEGEGGTELEEGMQMEERIDGSNLQIYEGGKVTGALLGVLWCLAEKDMHAIHASESPTAPPDANTTLMAFSQWLQGTLAAVVDAGGAHAVEAERTLNAMTEEGSENDDSDSEEQDPSLLNVLDAKIPITMVFQSLNDTAKQVMQQVLRVRLQALHGCVERVEAAAEAVRKLSKSVEEKKPVSDVCVVEVVKSAVQAVGPKNSERGEEAEEGDQESELYGSQECSVVEMAQALCGVERIAKWELAVVEKVLVDSSFVKEK